ncbi:MAG: glutamate synthase subunit alpha, partial [Blastocatellia bacterium]
MNRHTTPQRQGLYDARNEHDACGVGFVVDVKGRKSSTVVKQALEVLLNLEHRGACGCETNTGDGAGVLLQTPDEFLHRQCADLKIDLPEFGQYGVGMVFLPQDASAKEYCEHEFENIIREEGQTLLGWRTVPTDNGLIGPTAKNSQPVIRQIFIGRGSDISELQAFERKLYVIRRRVTRAVKRSDIHQRFMFYVSSLSYKTIVYKGMLTAGQLPQFYPDLTEGDLTSALAMVHSRFSTNTFPSWARAHPYRCLAHNGEINTLRGNVNWMRARESKFESQLFGADLQKVLPLIDTEASDSGMFDNAFELLTLAGRSLPHVMMMMIPEPWSGNEFMTDQLRAFYEYHSFLMEPWDGPAAVAFTDGISIGAVLDRNGLRPARYYVTKNDLVVMASEVGVLGLPVDEVVSKGRLQPGRMFLVDTAQGRIIGDEELKQSLAQAQPYQQWLDEKTLRLEQLPEPPYVNQSSPEKLLLRQRVFGYTREELRLIIEPMAAEGSEPVGSMGTDTPLAVLSKRPQLLYNYFKQLFAQVTNPPIDGIREELIMSADTTVGPEANLLEPTPDCARQIKLDSPILTNIELEKLRLLGESDGPWGAPGFKSITLPILFKASRGGRELESALEEIYKQADAA